MADFLESEAEESEVDSEDEQPAERKKPKRKAAVQSDDEDEDEEDDEERLREELKDLIDDAPIEESGSDGEDSDASAGPKKRKKSDDELDDRLEDEDYDLIEENLGVKVARNKFKRLRRLEDDDSDNEGNDDPELEREVIAEKLFVGGSDDEDENRSESAAPRGEAEYDDENEDLESDADDFIVDDDGRPIAERKKKRKPIFTDASLQEGQDIFGVDFDYDEFEKYGEEDYEDEEEEDLDEYLEDEEEEGEKRRTKKGKAKRPSKKSIFEIYEPSELKRSHFTDLDNEIRKTDVPERMQTREVPITPVEEGSTELEDEAEWIYKQAFLKPPVSKPDAQEARERTRRGSSTITKIRQALDFMRNQTLEVPFIAFYRKEYVQPELSINDLWKVYKYDAKDGKLYVEIPNNIPNAIIYEPDKYCIDTFLDEEGKGVLNALICFASKPEQNNYALSSSCMLISCFFILLTVAVYAWIPELRNLHGMVLMAYLLSFFVGFLFLATMQILIMTQEITENICLVLTFIVYFSLLSAFFWLNVMCYDIWWTFSGKRAHGRSGTQHKRFVFYALYAFGVPTALTALLATLEFSESLPVQHPLLPMIRLQGCFLYGNSKLLYLYGPIVALCVANMTFFALTAFKIAKIKRETQVLQGRESSTHDQARKDTQRFTLYIKLFTVMGINWILEVVSSFYPDADVFWQFSDAYNVLVGLIIFIIFVCKKKTWKMIKKRIKDYQRSETANGGTTINNVKLSRWQTNHDRDASLETVKTTVGIGTDSRNSRINQEVPT